MTLEAHRAGEVLTEALFDATAVLPNDWVASETTLLLFIARDEFLAQVRAVPEAMLGLSRDLERRLSRTKALACDLALADVQTRLHRALARLAREEGEPAPEGTIIRKCPTQQEIGNEIGACRETVSRMIAEPTTSPCTRRRLRHRCQALQGTARRYGSRAASCARGSSTLWSGRATAPDSSTACTSRSTSSGAPSRASLTPTSSTRDALLRRRRLATDRRSLRDRRGRRPLAEEGRGAADEPLTARRGGRRRDAPRPSGCVSCRLSTYAAEPDRAQASRPGIGDRSYLSIPPCRRPWRP